MKIKSKQQIVNQLQILEGIALQMYRLINSLEKTGAIDGQLTPLVEMAMQDYINYIQEQV